MAAHLIVASAAGAAQTTGLTDAADINDNGFVGWPDLLAWTFFGTVGLLGAAVVAGMALCGVWLLVRGARQSAHVVWSDGLRPHRQD